MLLPVCPLLVALALTGPGEDLHTSTGARFSLPEFVARGPVVLVFWNSWLPQAAAFAKLVPEIEGAAARNGWPAAVVVFQEGSAAPAGGGAPAEDKLVRVIDTHGELVRYFQVTKAPAVLLVERDGSVRARCGPAAADVRALLAGLAKR
ncbi:MAG TPA: hypothetical protein VLW17_08505 [Thermoanaerobaculaceae bacterium]|nr:hypothetical protein [Thermoanaerobaculaceae bacterium]